MKFLMLLSSTVRGGVEEYALKICSAAVREGWEVHAAFPQTEQTRAASQIPQGSLIADFTANGVQYHPLAIGEDDRSPLAKLIKYPLRFLWTLMLLLKLKPDVVQIVLPWLDYSLSSILACGFLRIPTVVRFGLVPAVLPLRSWRLKLYHWVRPRNQQWVAVSDNNRRLISESFHIPVEEILRIYNGTKLNAIHRSPTEIAAMRQAMRQELGLADTDRLALTVGRLSAQKGYSDLIPILPELVQEFPDLRFAWVGEGELREELQQQLQARGIADRVSFLGYRSDVSQLLTAADLFVFPTRFEGHPSALLEAMAHGLAIVTSDASGIPEIFDHHVHGLMIRTEQSDELRDAIRWALHHPEAMQTMGQQAQRRMQDFSEEKMFRETLGLLQSLVSTTNAQSANVELSQ
jgi:glycosyltransferase involved in cell wall biosynthesis